MVTLQMVRAHLRLDPDRTDEDELLAHLIKVASVAIENECKRTFPPGEVPEPVQHACLLLIGHYYEHREETSDVALQTIPLASARLISPYRRLVGG